MVESSGWTERLIHARFESVGFPTRCLPLLLHRLSHECCLRESSLRYPRASNA
jgi:hypothetical protein